MDVLFFFRAKSIQSLQTKDANKLSEIDSEITQTNDVYTGQPSERCPTSSSRLLPRALAAHSVGNSRECSVCGKKFTNKSHFVEHSRIHTGEKPFKCNLCVTKFNRKHDLHRHYLKKHMGEVEPYKCTVCSKQFMILSSLRRHAKSHSEKLPYECTICDKKFFRRDSLNRHSKSVHQTSQIKFMY